MNATIVQTVSGDDSKMLRQDGIILSAAAIASHRELTSGPPPSVCLG